MNACARMCVYNDNSMLCTRKPRDQTSAGRQAPSGRDRRRRKNDYCYYLKGHAGQQNAAATAGPQINSRPVITLGACVHRLCRRRPPCKNIMIKPTRERHEGEPS